MRIRGKLFLSFVAIFIIMLLAFAIITYHTVAGKMVQTKKHYFALKAEAVATSLNAMVGEAEDHLEVLALENSLTQSLRTSNVNPQMEAVFKRAQERFHQMTAIALFDQNKKALAKIGTFSEQPLHDLLNGDKREHHLFSAANDGLYLAIPLQDRKQTVGFLVCRLNVDAMYAHIYNHIEPENTFYILAKEREILLTLSHEGNRDAADLKAGREVKLYQYRSPLGDTCYEIRYAVPPSVQTEELRRFKDEIIVATIIIMWASIWIVLIVANRISQPIVSLTQASKDMIELDYTTPLPTGEGINEISELSSAFETMRQKIKELVIRDPLTEVYNRRFAMQVLETEIARSHRMNIPLACLLMDVDLFKRVNDLHGHLCGDHVLKEMGKMLLSRVREYDVLARYGGEEFMLLLPATEKDKAFDIAERIRKAVKEQQFGCGDTVIKVTMSIGAAVLQEHMETPEMLLAAADRALYEAKKSRDKTVMADRLSPDKS